MPRGIYVRTKPVWSKGKKCPQISKWRKKKVKENSPNWKGDNVGYTGIHLWLRNTYGKPNKCEHCGEINKKKYDWANFTGIYKRDIKNFIRLCRSCHLKLDRNK